ncbi:MAG: PAS domain-containing protein [Gemmatimonadales bacterium]|nr:PAS domain-containing protein [Gemmatimonadales bacterium]
MRAPLLSADSAAFRAVLDTLEDGVIITDAERRVLWTNQAIASICGHEMLEMLGRRPGDLLQGPLTDPETIRTIRDGLAEGRDVDVEIVNYHRDGRPYWIHLRILAVRGIDGGIERFVAIERLLTRRAEGEPFAHDAPLLHRCAWCGRVEDAFGYWHAPSPTFERREHRVSHSMCADCAVRQQAGA